MDCLKAQEIISSALDRGTEGDPLLAHAKEHCRSCAECGAFVKSLVLVRRAASPKPPADLGDRVMAAVRAEHARAQRAAESIAAVSRLSDAASQPHEEPELTTAGLVERLRDRRNRRAVLTWAGAAAVVLIVAGFGAVAGVRSIMDSGGSPEMVMTAPSEDAAVSPYGTAGTALQSQQPADSAVRSTESASGVGLIVLEGIVYQHAGEDRSVSRSGLDQLGAVRSSLDVGGTVRSLTALGTSDPSRIFIADGQGAMLAFDRVTTSFQGRTYALRSAGIDHFGTLATLPDDVPEPSSSTGSPVFEPVDEEVTPSVYHRTGQGAEDGIALPPGAKPAVADGWSWWTPIEP